MKKNKAEKFCREVAKILGAKKEVYGDEPGYNVEYFYYRDIAFVAGDESASAENLVMVYPKSGGYGGNCEEIESRKITPLDFSTFISLLQGSDLKDFSFDITLG